LYKSFAKLTTLVMEYLAIARRHESSTRIEVPKLRHAPTSLANMLQEYLNDPDFEVNRRQYLAEQEAKSKRPANGGAKAGSDPKPSTAQPAARQQPSSQSSAAAARSENAPGPAKGSGPNMIDFFAPIDAQPTYANNQAPSQSTIMFQQQQVQQALQQAAAGGGGGGMPQLQTGFPNQQQQQQQQPQQQPFGSQPTGAYGGQYGQPAPQFGNQQVQQNPMMTGFGGNPSINGFMNQSPTTYSGSSLGVIPQGNQASFQAMPPQLNNLQTGQQQPQITNPFRQSAMFTGQPQPNLGQFNQTPFSSSSGSMDPSMGQQPSTNPFARSNSVSSHSVVTQNPSLFNSQPNPSGNFQQQQFQQQQFQQQQQQQIQQQQASQTLHPAQTGTNPFAKLAQQSSQPQGGQVAANPLAPQPTGSTNPFRSFTSQNSWPANQGTIGGMPAMPSMSVFPPGGPQQQQQSQQHSWG
jgi:hypothetical protein